MYRGACSPGITVLVTHLSPFRSSTAAMQNVETLKIGKPPKLDPSKAGMISRGVVYYAFRK